MGVLKEPPRLIERLTGIDQKHRTTRIYLHSTLVKTKRYRNGKRKVKGNRIIKLKSVIDFTNTLFKDKERRLVKTEQTNHILTLILINMRERSMFQSKTIWLKNCLDNTLNFSKVFNVCNTVSRNNDGHGVLSVHKLNLLIKIKYVLDLCLYYNTNYLK